MLNFHLLVVLVHIFCSNTKTFKIPSKLDTNATDYSVVINENVKEPGDTKNNELHDDQHANAPEQIHFRPGSTNDQSMLSKTYILRRLAP